MYHFLFLLILNQPHKHHNYWIVKNNNGAKWIDYRKENNKEFKYTGPFKTLSKVWKEFKKDDSKYIP